MKLRTFLTLFRNGTLLGSIPLIKRTNEYYRTVFVVAASGSGLLRALEAGPLTSDAILERLGVEQGMRQVVEAWLAIGVGLKELAHDGKLFRLKGKLSRSMAREQNDVLAATLEEVVRFHGAILLAAPRLRESERLELSDQDGAVIARSTRLIEPFVHEAIDLAVPLSGRCRLLEVGCGSGVHMRHAAQRNPDLTGVGLEMQQTVAEAAKRSMKEWCLSDRLRVEAADFMEYRGDERFDLVTLHNNIYYFPMERRVEVLSHAREMLVPGGRLLLTSGCQGGNIALDMINLWFLASSFGGPLPEPKSTVEQIRAAGFVEPAAHGLMPGGTFYAFIASNPG